MNMPEKLAIVMSGGGTACAFTVGVIAGLVECYRLFEPDIIIGSSGSSCIAAYYAAGQYFLLKEAWDRYVPSKEIINPLRFWKIVDVDHLVDYVAKKAVPLDTDSYYNAKPLCLIAATNVETGEPTYFSNRDRSIDVHEAMRASAAIPLAYGREVVINGEHYCDSMISTSVALHILKAREQGATKIIAIDTSSNTFGLDEAEWFHQWWSSRYPKAFIERYAFWRHEANRLAAVTAADVFTIKPSKKNIASAIDGNRKKILQTMDSGYAFVRRDQMFKNWLDKNKEIPPARASKKPLFNRQKSPRLAADL